MNILKSSWFASIRLAKVKFIGAKYAASVAIAAYIFSAQVFAHAEHDKARYVAPSGEDVGRCDKATSPCNSIYYAVQHANKGDKILVGAGSYRIDNDDTLFYLLSDLIPVIPNYQSDDNFAKRDKNNLTHLIGVPVDYVSQLTNKGFTVLVDRKVKSTRSAAQKKQSIALTQKLQSYQRLQQAKDNMACVDGIAGDHACNNLDLLSHLPLSSFSTTPAKANDIWGHFDLNSGKEYAIIGLDNGISVVDVSVPESPEIVNTIASQTTGWRDIKVYQFYHVNLAKWQSYAYVTADNATVGIMILDLNQLPNTVTVAFSDASDISAHNVYLSNVDYSTGVALTGLQPYLHITGSNFNGGGFNTYSLEQPTTITSVYKPEGNRNQYTHDASAMVITDERKNNQCINGSDHCEILFDFNENDFQLWDKTDNSLPQKLSTTTYDNASYVHSGWYSEDKLMVLVHDELDEQNNNLNTTLRLFDLTNLTAPSLLSTWTGPTRAIDHNGYVRGNRYYMSNYERGITVLDLSNPLAPAEVGFFDTYPISDNASFNGAWGVYPFLPSGNILVSDINSGLYVLKDNTLTVNQGSLRFNADNFQVSEGNTISVEVNRIGGDEGEVNVQWEFASGSANTSDFTLGSGNLSWADKDSTSKTITVTVTDDNIAEASELFFVRLFDPKNGATLSSPSLSTITIAPSTGLHAPEVIMGNNFAVDTGQTVTLTASVSDQDNDALSYLWQQTSGETVSINNADTLNANFIAPTNNADLAFELTVTDSAGLTAKGTIKVYARIEVVVVTPQPTTTSSSGGGSYSYLLLMLLSLTFFLRQFRSGLKQ